MMRYILLIIALTYVSATELLKGVEVLKNDEQKAQASMLEMLRDHDGEEHMKNVFDYMAEGMKEFFEDLNSVSDEDMGLDNRTKTGFDNGTDEAMWAIYEDVCNQGAECTDSPFMGCNCHGHFKKLKYGMCQEFPCGLVKYGLENAAKLLRDIRKQTSLEGLIEVGMKFAEPILKNACHCNPSLFEAAVSCAKDYNGGMLEKKDRKEYRQFVKKIKFDDMIEFTKTMFKAYCGTEDGTCLGNFQNVFTELAAMMDRSFVADQKDQCNNFRRLSDPIYKLIAYLTNEEKELTPKRIVAGLQRFVFKEFWCADEDCVAGHLSENFNNDCCFRNAVDQFREKTVKHLVRYIGSIVKASGGEMPKIPKKVRMWVSQMFNPNRMCESLYAGNAEACAAVRYGK